MILFAKAGEIVRRLKALLRPNQFERELEEEMRLHRDLREQQQVQSGVSAEEARLAARRRFGNATLLKEASRDMWGWVWLEDFVHDLRHGIRVLRKTPGFTAVAVLTLALGIGANTAIFSVVNALILRPLPVEKPGSLVQFLRYGWGGMGSHFSYPDFADLRGRNHVFSAASGVAWLEPALLDARWNGEPENIAGQMVSGNFFSLLGIRPSAGRLLTPDDDMIPGGTQVAVLSYSYWQRRFNHDPSVLGKTILLRQRPFTIAGVAPADFVGIAPGYAPDLYIPIATEPVIHDGKTWLDKRGYSWIQIVARLKPGVSLPPAQAEIAAIYQQMLQQRIKPDWSQKDRDVFLSQRAELTPASSGLSDVRRDLSKSLLILTGMVALVLLISCANIASMVLARAVARQKEFAVRLALGAGRGRLLRQLLTESVLLGLAGGAAGLLLAVWLANFLAALISMGQGRIHINLYLDARVLGFAAAVSVLTAVLFGLAPALQACRLTVSSALKETRGSLSAGLRRIPIGKALVVMQVGFSVVLLFGAGLFVHTFRNLQTLNPGFNRENVLLLSVDPAPGGFKGPRAADLYHRLLERLHSLPQVRSASASAITPIMGGGWNSEVEVEGYSAKPDEEVAVDVNSVSPKFFDTLQTPLLLGRDFGPQDTGDSPKVAIINQAFSRSFFGNQNPLGKKMGWTEGNSKKKEFVIVGVVADAKYMDMREQPPRTAYIDCFQDEGIGALSLEVRTEGSPSPLVREIRAALEQIAGGAQLANFKTLGEQVDESLAHERMIAILATLFGGLALVLAAVGLYGLMAYSVAQKTNEIGIRMALGAQRRDILGMVSRESLAPVVLGVAAGLPCALLASRLISSMLYETKPADPWNISLSALVMLVIAAVACYVPARRAMRVDPMIALRYE